MNPDVTIITAGKPHLLNLWAAAWLASPNAGKFRVLIGASGFSADFASALSARGFGLFDMVPLEQRAMRDFAAVLPNGKTHTPHHRLWASKVLAIMQCPTRYAVWLDHDCEVRGDIVPAIEWAMASRKWLCAPFYQSFGTGRYNGKRVAQNGLVVVDTQSARLQEWYAEMVRFNHPNDESIFPMAYGFDRAREMMGDLYRPEWYASCDCYPIVNRKPSNVGIELATRELKRNGVAAVRHWCAGAGKRAFESIWKERRLV